MSLFPGLPYSKQLLPHLMWPIITLQKIWWMSGYLLIRHNKSGDDKRILRTTGAFSFVAIKPQANLG